MILGPYMVPINSEHIRNNSRISNQYAVVPKTLNEQDRKYMINKKQNH
jgi:hypothetical protein